MECDISLQWNLTQQLKGKKVLIHTKMSMNLENILSERSQTKKTTYYIIPFMSKVQNR